MGREAARGEVMTAAELRNAALIGSIARSVREVLQCIREQQSTLADLRGEMAKLRERLRERRSAAQAAGAERNRAT